MSDQLRQRYLAVKVVMMPRDTNPHGTIFGGDQCSAGILPLDAGRALIAYYDGEPYEMGESKRADIKLAHLRIE